MLQIKFLQEIYLVMIDIKDLNNSKPYNLFSNFYKVAIKNNQNPVNAISISSLDAHKLEVDSRYVNLKCINNDEWIFFSNYNSPKAMQFKSHDQIAALIYWNKTNIQIRIKAKIKKSDFSFSNKVFKSRDNLKNALAISSRQSELISSYQEVENNFNKIASQKTKINVRPDYWGGYSFVPYYFEFWEGHESRLNKREVYKKIDDTWKHLILQP